MIDFADIAPFETIDDVIQGLGVAEARLAAAGDRRGIFVEAYLLITQELKRRIAAGVFADGAWVGRYAAAFAELYRRALVGDEQGGAIPKPWRIAFDAARDPATLVMQNLALGINAHINNDLPNALRRVGIDPDRELRHRDHDAVNAALRAATDPVQVRLGELYAPALSKLDADLGPLDERITQFSFEKARAAAWASGLALVNAPTPAEAENVRAHIDEQAAVLARLILAPSRDFPGLTDALRRAEDGGSWLAAGSGGALGRAATLLDPQLAVQSIPELVDRLGGLIARFDAARSRLSVYPTVYLDVSRRFATAISTPGFFGEPDFVKNLDLHFATLYLRALEAFEGGRTRDIPLTWAVTLQAASDDRTSILQDILLALNVRLNHDLPIALHLAGVTAGDSATRVADYLRIHELFHASIDPVQRILARKYSRFLGFLDFIGGPIDEYLIDSTYIHARDGALEKARALARLPSDGARRELLANLDLETADKAKKILLSTLPGGRWVTAALRKLEDRFTGTWSDYVQADA
jgi:hypothetical protein